MEPKQNKNPAEQALSPVVVLWPALVSSSQGLKMSFPYSIAVCKPLLGWFSLFLEAFLCRCSIFLNSWNSWGHFILCSHKDTLHGLPGLLLKCGQKSQHHMNSAEVSAGSGNSQIPLHQGQKGFWVPEWLHSRKCFPAWLWMSWIPQNSLLEAAFQILIFEPEKDEVFLILEMPFKPSFLFSWCTLFFMQIFVATMLSLSPTFRALPFFWNKKYFTFFCSNICSWSSL